jgi:hypothetical protein
MGSETFGTPDVMGTELVNVMGKVKLAGGVEVFVGKGGVEEALLRVIPGARDDDGARAGGTGASAATAVDAFVGSDREEKAKEGI